MHKFHVRFTGENTLVTIDVTFKVYALNYADAEAQGWSMATALLSPEPGTPKLEIRAIHIGECEAGCL